jgi:hypothetical protein
MHAYITFMVKNYLKSCVGGEMSQMTTNKCYCEIPQWTGAHNVLSSSDADCFNEELTVNSYPHFLPQTSLKFGVCEQPL